MQTKVTTKPQKTARNANTDAKIREVNFSVTKSDRPYYGNGSKLSYTLDVKCFIFVFDRDYLNHCPADIWPEFDTVRLNGHDITPLVNDQESLSEEIHELTFKKGLALHKVGQSTPVNYDVVSKSQTYNMLHTYIKDGLNKTMNISVKLSWKEYTIKGSFHHIFRELDPDGLTINGIIVPESDEYWSLLNSFFDEVHYGNADIDGYVETCRVLYDHHIQDGYFINTLKINLP